MSDDHAQAESHSGNATIKDVAALANVALSSVSRVFSGHPDVSEKMRAKVERAAAELGYEPDHLAQALRQGRTMSVGFLLRDISNPLFADIAKRCEHDLRQAGYSMLIMSSDGEADVEAANLTVLRRRRVDGVIASLVTEVGPETVAALAGFNVPLVLVDRDVSRIPASAVLTDHFPGVRDAVRALLASGRRRIALVTGNVDVRSTRERIRAIEAAHADVGMKCDPELLLCGTFDTDWGHRASSQLLSRTDPPDAILGGGIAPSLGVIRAVREAGLVLGEDVLLVALDEWPDFDILTPDVPSVRRDPASMGGLIASEMLRVLGGGAPSATLLPTVFEARGALIGTVDAS